MQVSRDASNQLAIDPNATERLSSLARSNPKEAIRQVASQFEAILLNQMMASMRSNGFDGEEDSSELGTYRGMLDQQMVNAMVQGGGTGLADMLARQIEGVARIDQAATPAASSGMLPLPALPAAAAKAIRKYAEAAGTATAAPAPVAIPSERQAFVSTLLPHAGPAAERLGVAPELLVGHAALESGWGSRSIRHPDGRESYNLFGIKAGGSWRGESVATLTTEYVDGKARKQVESFRSYPSLQAAFDDYAKLLEGSSRYQRALNQGDNAQGFAVALQQGGYATDPAYARKLAGVAQSLLAR
ncbi:flagellar assembly peptidoglycan hydrolase FlgJ [Vogesella indigofera]|uniref:flagellar assembly peptidoglycan hydrolase FlgJ n=1 Tax=Vogesella indigofera TaxID=45465 RepID=UPI00234E40A9|nr:flagellar assembly peptidoglycan hydrolase FlgJ [Vogesella indigofera]MDC7698675.1 flagellar assembly peptidoglycan hydrolase FlgJ [Vogesella indigofera]